MDKNEAMALRQNQMMQSIARSEADQATELKRATAAIIETNKALRQLVQEMTKCTAAVYTLIDEIKVDEPDIMEELSDDHR